MLKHEFYMYEAHKGYNKSAQQKDLCFPYSGVFTSLS